MFSPQTVVTLHNFLLEENIGQVSVSKESLPHVNNFREDDCSLNVTCFNHPLVISIN